jgi:DNA modification methylase
VNDPAVDAVAASIREFGFRQPIVVDEDGVIVVGHTRWKAAQKLGLEQVPVHVARDLTPEQRKAYRLADNKTADLASWDLERLAVELTDLQSMNVDLEMLGFTADELATLIGGNAADGLCDPDEVPEPPDEAVTKRGDLVILGNHRLLCGDSANAEDVDRLLDGNPVHLVNCDPPYNVKVEPRSNNAISEGLSSFSNDAAARKVRAGQGHAAFDIARGAALKKGRGGTALKHHQGLDLARHPEKAKGTTRKMRPKDRPLENDFVSDEEFERLLGAWFGNLARVLLPGRGFYIWGGYANCGNYPPVLRESGLYFSQAIIWDKEHPVLTRKDYMGAHEWCFYGWKEGAAHVFLGPPNVTDLWHVKKVNPQSMIHLTEKPTELAVRALQFSSRQGENVVDLFGGSGSTLIAAEQTGRRAFLMEIDPAYCDVIVERWQKFTGRKAERITDRTNAPVGTEALGEEA